MTLSESHVGIIIVGYRNAADVVRCLGYLARSNYADFSIWICENGGDDAAAELMSELAREAVAFAPGETRTLAERIGVLVAGGRCQEVHCLNSGANLGYAGGINVCLAAMAEAGLQTRGVWILNPDTEPSPGALAALVAHQTSGDYAIVGSRLVLKGKGTVQLYAGRWRRWMARGYNIGLGQPKDDQPDVVAIEALADYVSGASLFVASSFIRRVGPLDDRYFLYCEEVDWCLRRGDARIGYAHESVVIHAHGSTIGSSHLRSGRSPLAVYLEERNRLLLTRKHYPGSFAVVALITLMLTAQYAAEGGWRNWGFALVGWWAGIRGETGFPKRFVR